MTQFRMQLNCPLPELDFDVITMGHGSGGVLTNKLLDDVILNLFSDELENERHDGAQLSLEGNTAFTTDSFVVSPLFFPGGNIGDLAVNGTINDLAMCGAIPQYLSLSLIIEEGLPMTDLWEVLLTIQQCCKQAEVKVVTGDTKVVERGKGDKLFINTAGIGKVHPQADIGINRVQAGDKIIVSGPLANHGMAIMSVREGLEFETEIQTDSAPLHQPVKNLLDEFGSSVHLLRDPTRGGVGTVLNEIARSANLGVNLRQVDIPVDEQVAGACELLGLDPLYVANEGLFLAIVAEDIYEAALGQLRENGFARSACIGEVTDEHLRQVVLTSGIGGRRVVNMLAGEQLPRIC
ncbi:hydrogenase expression/formation protein HypE [Tunicatimonas pelagia]|uniref:hydrogenase expression/formation protein HypE n=1 Tax=Tunicatimonas pelagia TaxID=931531 RepID=UPI0026666C54|nr:hydrogenase expression/formation protein HypE [Tunicatimonas pelagia]WKN41334.1 hydrogenase expression/formation protein HypE [Tunicatimonas pelagia]